MHLNSQTITKCVCSIPHLHLNFQDSLEFSPPRIHSPYYHIDDTCNPYAKDEKLFLETFQKHYNYPQKSEKIDSGAESVQRRTFVLLFVSLVVVVGGKLF